jgi:Mg2+ and Co2+ transporter CorA
MLHILPTRGDIRLQSTVALWLDLLNSTSAEVTSVEEAIGAKLPTLGALSEIESSSRLRSRGGILYMSTPSAAGASRGRPDDPSNRVRAVDRSADHRPLHAAAVLRRRRQEIRLQPRRSQIQPRGVHFAMRRDRRSCRRYPGTVGRGIERSID